MKPRLLAITPPEGRVDPRIVERWEEAGALRIGLAVLLRRPGDPTRTLDDPGLADLRRACTLRAIPLLLSCAAEAFASMADARLEGLAGIQLRGDPDDATLERARRRLGGRTLGCSAHGVPGAPDRCAAADYVCFAPVYPPRTATPGVEKSPAGVGALRAWTAGGRRHVVALGGIAADNARACVEAGARGLAGIECFFGRPAAVTEDVRSMVTALEPLRPGR